MKTNNATNINTSRFLWGMGVVAAIILLAKFGYLFGQWLYQQIH